jgi:hypothetical protein
MTRSSSARARHSNACVMRPSEQTMGIRSAQAV